MVADLANRRSFIGGSDARTIMGDDEAALLRLWREKRGEVEPEDLSGNLIVQLGVVTEPLNRDLVQTHHRPGPREVRSPREPSCASHARQSGKSHRLPRMDASAPLHLGMKKTRRALFPPWKPRLSTSKAFPAPVFVDEYDPGALQSGSDCFDSFHRNLPPFFLEVDDRREPKLGRVRKLRLRDFQEPTSSSTLRRRHFINNFC